jgi:hypothetical protein
LFAAIAQQGKDGMMAARLQDDRISSTLGALFGDRRPTRWVTRERPKIDRIACPWLVRRFVDADAEFLFVPTERVFETAEREGAVAFDIPGAPFSHEGERCSFDSFLIRFGLESEPGLERLAPIVRGADTDRHDLAPEAAGLHAVSLGLAQMIEDDLELLERGMTIYDSLYRWATEAGGVRHAWQPEPGSGR